MSVPRCRAFALRAAARVVAAWTPLGTPGSRVAADSQLDSAHPDGLEAVASLFRHALWQIHELVMLVDVDVPDQSAVQVRLVRDRADDIPRLDAVGMADFDAIRFESRALSGPATRP